MPKYQIVDISEDDWPLGRFGPREHNDLFSAVEKLPVGGSKGVKVADGTPRERIDAIRSALYARFPGQVHTEYNVKTHTLCIRRVPRKTK